MAIRNSNQREQGTTLQTRPRRGGSGQAPLDVFRHRRRQALEAFFRMPARIRPLTSEDPAPWSIAHPSESCEGPSWLRRPVSCSKVRPSFSKAPSSVSKQPALKAIRIPYAVDPGRIKPQDAITFDHDAARIENNATWIDHDAPAIAPVDDFETPTPEPDPPACQRRPTPCESDLRSCQPDTGRPTQCNRREEF